jgi:hypothetical protein
LAILATAPITLDEVTIGRIVAFGEAVRRLLIDESLDERNLFRRELIDAALENTPLWADLIDAAHLREDGLSLVEIAPGWVRVEDPITSEALGRVLKRNRRG